ncbi:UDP-N-acetylmuramate dehydrogenase [Niabella digestorum]|uniref:UDP-N-acetylenolpyruvoylglucosamine reductase n=1 Tax=Niabella digestorum TaxID=3117701 RepID=A0ABU7RE62_9BACT
MSVSIISGVSLKPYNTFGIDVQAEYLARAGSLTEVQECLQWVKHKPIPCLVLGGGSNILLTQSVQGLVIKNEVKGIEKIYEDEESVYLKVGAGEVWHQFVLYCLQHNYAGVENLALIPGSVGASPLQNIGAYGVEIKEVFHELTAMHRRTAEVVHFSHADCAFGYRDSVFKHKYKNEFVIIDVTFRLSKTPRFNIEYGAIKQELDKRQISELSIHAIAEAVMAIRTSKLPDPAQIGNAGSFFKNPSVAKEQYLVLKEKFPGLVAYENQDGSMKLAAGWLIEQCGLKGYRNNDAGVHEKQALVLVNYGNATGAEILQVCNMVQHAVEEKFGVKLEPEVNII